MTYVAFVLACVMGVATVIVVERGERGWALLFLAIAVAEVLVGVSYG
jgi:hypothetical protein